MDYSQKSLTKDGLMMLSGSDADSTSIVIDKMIVSQQSIDKSIDLKYLTLSDFTNPIEFNINSVQKNDDSFQVKAAVSNNATGNILTSDYKVALIGVVAHTSTDSTDKLLGVVVGVDPFILPAYNNVPVSYIAGVTFGYSNATNITIQIKNDVYALSTDVQALDKATVKDNHDGTITANGTTFTPADSETVAQLRTDFDTLDVGGVNLIQGTSRNGLNVLVPDKHAEFLTKGLVDESLPHSQYYLCRIWFQLPDVDMYVGLHLAGNGGTETVTGSVVKAGTSGYSQIQVKMKDGQYPYESFVQTVGDVGGFYLTYKRYSVEAGTKFTDWSPAPDEMASKDDVTTGMNQANAYTDAGLKPKADDAKVIHNDSGYGAENLIMNSGYPTGTEGWVTGGNGFNNSASAFRVGTHAFYHNSLDTVFQLWNGSQTDEAFAYTDDYFAVTPGEQISWQFKAFAGTNIKGVNARIAYNNTSHNILTNAHPNPSQVEQFAGIDIVPAGATSAHFTITNSGTTNDKASLLAFTEIKFAHESQISQWSQANYAGGLSTGTLGLSTNFYRYHTTDRNDGVTWHKFGNIVTIHGTIEPAVTLPAMNTPVLITNWPGRLGQPITDQIFICQGSNAAIWQLEVNPNCTINFSHYRGNDGTNGFTVAGPDVWLPFSATFVVH